MKADATAKNKPACTLRNTATDLIARNAHEYQRSVQVFVVFLHKVAIILVGFTLEPIVGLSVGAAGGSKQVRKER